MEKIQISVKNLNNLWSFIIIYAVFVLNLCGEKSVWRKTLWRKNDKYEVCERFTDMILSFPVLGFALTNMFFVQAGFLMNIVCLVTVALSINTYAVPLFDLNRSK